MVCAVLIRRAILQNAPLAQRRSLFEVLSIYAYVVAIALSVFSLLNWTGQPFFVLGCSALWALFSLSVVLRLWWINHVGQTRKTLDIPDVWDEPDNRKQAENHAADRSDAAIAVAAIADAVVLHSVEPAVAESSSVRSNMTVQSDSVAESMSTGTAPTGSQAADTQVRGVSKATIRAARLQQYRRERLSRYRQTRSGRRTGGNNLAIYRRLTRNGTSNSN